MASLTDKLTDTRNAARPNSARVTSGRSAAGTTLICDNLAGWPTASKVHFVTYTIDSNSNPVAGTQLDCYGLVSGNNIGSFTVVDGNDTGNVIGDVVEMLPTAAWGQDLSDALNQEHNRTGTHKNITTDTIVVSSGTTLPAGDIGTADLATDSVSTVKVQADAITDAKLVYGKIRSRQGGSATNWFTDGTTTFDYSATNTFIQVGSLLVNANPVTVTFPTAFNQVPIVLATVKTAAVVNAYTRIIATTATNFQISVFDQAGSAVNSESVSWMAIGEWAWK